MSTRIDEYSGRPSNPKDGDTYRDEHGEQWSYIGEVSDWGLDLTDPETNERYHCLDHLPKGDPDAKGVICGYRDVFKFLDECIIETEMMRSKRPSNPVDGDTCRDENNMQWSYNAEIEHWGFDLTDPETYVRYHCIEHLLNGEPVYRVEDLKDDDIVGYDADMRTLDENK